MTWTHTNPIWKRTWYVDENGIHECRSGRIFASITWDELESLESGSASSNNGKHISLLIDRRDSRNFLRAASTEWRNRHPDRAAKNSRRIGRTADWSAYLGLPLFTLGPLLFFYILDWFLGWPEDLSPKRQSVNRMSIFGVIFIGAFICWYRFKTRARRCTNDGTTMMSDSSGAGENQHQ